MWNIRSSPWVVQQGIKLTLNLARLEVGVACGSDLGSVGWGMGRQVFFSVQVPRDAHVYRKPSRKPLNSVAKCSDPSTADPDIVLGPN